MTKRDMADAAVIIRRLVRAVRDGELSAPKRVVAKMEGAAIALEEAASERRSTRRRRRPRG